eukprot:SAG22_NODE_2512_length_2489_cov_17.765690_1_plen_580_part_10
MSAEGGITTVYDCKSKWASWKKNSPQFTGDFTDKGALSKLISKPKRGANAYFQWIKYGEWTTPLFDLDDRCRSLEEATEQTRKFVSWAETTCAKMFGYSTQREIEQNIAVRTAVGPDVKHDGLFKASCHVNVRGYMLLWEDHKRMLWRDGDEENSLFEEWRVNLPDKFDPTETAEQRAKGCIDSIYANGRAMRMINSAKPGDLTRSSTPAEFSFGKVSCSKKSLWKHVPTTNLEGHYINLTHDMSQIIPYYRHQTSEEEVQDEEAEDEEAEDEEAEDEEDGPLPDVAMPEQPLEGVLPSLVQFCDEDRTAVGPHLFKFSATDVCQLLSHCPASSYKDWYRIGTFMKNKTRKLFDDPFQVFMAWSQTSEAHWSGTKKITEKLLRDDHWKGWNDKTINFGSLRYITQYASKEGEEFVLNWKVDKCVRDIFAKGKGTGDLTESDLARILVHFTGLAFKGNPDGTANQNERLFQLGNGNIWRGRSKISMSDWIERILRFEVIKPALAYNVKVHAEAPGDTDKVAEDKEKRQKAFHKKLSGLYGDAQKNLGDSGLQDSIYNQLRRKHVSDGQSVQWNPYDKLQTK